MKNRSFKRFIYQLLIALLALILSGIIYQLRHVTTDSRQYLDEFRSGFRMLEEEVGAELDAFVARYIDTEGEILKDAAYLKKLEQAFRDDGYVFVIYDGEMLEFWSHNALPKIYYVPPENVSGALEKPNGWYYYQQQIIDGRHFLLYCIVKQDFRYQNRFLVNRFHDKLPALEKLFFISDRTDEGYPVYDGHSNYLFSLVLRREAGLIQPAGILYALSLVFAIASLMIFVFSSFRYLSRLFHAGKRSLAIGGFILTLGFIRLISFWLQIPTVFYDGVMFSPGLYAASDLLPSLGDLFLNVTLISILAYFIYYNLRQFAVQPLDSKGTGSIMGFGLFTLIYLICGWSLYLIRGLVINSQLNLDVNFIFNLDIYSLIGFLIIGLIFFAFFFFSVLLCRLALSLLGSVHRFYAVSLFTFALLIVVTWIFREFSPTWWMLAIASILVFELDRRNKSAEKALASLVIALFLFSLVSTFALYQFNEEKDLEKRKTLVLQLASEQDPVAEFLFNEIEEALFNDNQLQNLVRRDPYNETAIYNYLQHHYFYDFWAKYDMQVTVCAPGEMLLIKPANIEQECSAFFYDYITAFGKETISDYFIYLDNNTGRNSYITKIPVSMGEDPEHVSEYHVYLEFDSKFIAREMGFPELLIDDAIDINRELINYSYATYKEGVLVNEFGPYVYGVDPGAYKIPENEFSLFEFDGYSHLMYQQDEETLLLISRPKRTLLEGVAPFSYLFITFFVLVIVFWLLVSKQKPSALLKMNFKRRVQYSMITILVVSALAIGGVSAWFIYNIYENKNLSVLNEKAHGVVQELEFTLADQRVLDYTMEYYLYDILLQYSNVFFTDINLYAPNGFLLASSRPKVFEEGLVGSKMNALAYLKVHNEKKSKFVHSEYIGKLEYLSAYTPLFNRYHELLAYVNLPYFAKEGEMRNEVTYFLVAFINIYLLLLVLAFVVALFISNYVTQPLQLIRDSMARVKLGRSNQKIQWTREDEIGSLIREYNRMIDELSVSAELLARSERESAWREMARQVAHEIKNPLTPMKLSVQYLEKAWNEKVPDWDDRLERFSKTMIEQIDNLSAIASEFSHFAQMPAGKNSLINLRTFVPEVLDLYKDFEKVNIHQKMPPGDEPMMVLADKNQLIRVFNNLIKNAMQAYEKQDTAYIEVRCREREDSYHIEVADQGCGIPKKLQHHIFNPYFTTKAKGMGLGLSMVKNIIESINGEVRFESKEGQGSTFVVVLPEARRVT